MGCFPTGNALVDGARQRLGVRLSSTAFCLGTERAREKLWQPSIPRPFPKRKRTGALQDLADHPIAFSP